MNITEHEQTNHKSQDTTNAPRTSNEASASNEAKKSASHPDISRPTMSSSSPPNDKNNSSAYPGSYESYPEAYSKANPTSAARLSDQQKKLNHIQSETKRREAIRVEFNKLAATVPGMSGQGRSEAVVLQATVEHLREQVAKKEELRMEAKRQGWSDEEFEAGYEPVAQPRSSQQGRRESNTSGRAGI
ncbi:Transcription factor [Elasticomyces elasticus]|nr:Transcription factor [Elasticomyces elasticus]